MRKNYKLFTLVAIALCIATSGFAQTTTGHWCGTDHTDEFMERLTKNVKYANTHAMKMDTRYLPIKFHLVANSEGQGRIPESQVFQQLCRLNEQYESLDIQFYIHEGFSYHDDDIMYNHNGGAQSRYASARNQNRGVINAFLTLNTFDEGTAGYYTGQSDYLVVRKSSFFQEDNGTFGHELGHLLSLSHPHYGWEDDPYTPELYGEIVTITSIQSSQSPSVQVEVMDDPNCSTKGDRICDTPPDYGFTQNGGDGAQVCVNPWAGFVKDRNGVLIETYSNLIMGYNGNCIETIFSPGQGEAMVADYERRIALAATSLEYLMDDYTPELTQVTEVPAKNSPTAFQTTDYFDSVVLSWEPVDNAQAYIVILGGDVQETYETTDTEFELTDLEPDGTYTWDVYPMHEYGVCAEAGGSILFFTGSGSTAVNEVAAVNSFAVHPNPVKDQAFNITISSNEKLDATISLYNLAGQSILGDLQHTLTSGNNLIPITMTNAPAGLYHLFIKTEKGILSEKLIVE